MSEEPTMLYDHVHRMWYLEWQTGENFSRRETVYHRTKRYIGELSDERNRLQFDNAKLMDVCKKWMGKAAQFEAERDRLREELEDERSENGWAREFLSRIGPKCGTHDVPSLPAYVSKLEAENAKLRTFIDLKETCWKYIGWCGECPYNGVDDEHDDCNCTVREKVNSLARELGIEVPNEMAD